MPFTKEEFEAWHKAKLDREWRPTPEFRDPPIATCVHCHRHFGITEGMVTDEFAICDICNDD
jgi:hypothetical protein